MALQYVALQTVKVCLCTYMYIICGSVCDRALYQSGQLVSDQLSGPNGFVIRGRGKSEYNKVNESVLAITSEIGLAVCLLTCG